LGYFLAFGFIYVGYSLLDWGHYIIKHEHISLWYLMSGLGDATLTGADGLVKAIPRGTVNIAGITGAATAHGAASANAAAQAIRNPTKVRK
jgi:hypothetical protein